MEWYLEWYLEMISSTQIFNQRSTQNVSFCGSLKYFELNENENVIYQNWEVKLKKYRQEKLYH